MKGQSTVALYGLIQTFFLGFLVTRGETLVHVYFIWGVGGEEGDDPTHCRCLNL